MSIAIIGTSQWFVKTGLIWTRTRYSLVNETNFYHKKMKTLAAESFLFFQYHFNEISYLKKKKLLL